jgi:hypothetical protein
MQALFVEERVLRVSISKIDLKGALYSLIKAVNGRLIKN